MKTISNLVILALLGFAFCCKSKVAADSRYALLHRITDHADILTIEQEDSLIAMMEDLESRVGSQIAILTIPDLDGQKIEEVSIRTAEASKLGRATHDDGILITIAHHDQQMRIEVGTGLETVLSDEIAARIIREDLARNSWNKNLARGCMPQLKK